MKRIMLEEEFIAKYGHTWRTRVSRGFPMQMDSLMGREVSMDENDIVISLGGYSVSREMLTDAPFPPDYKKPQVVGFTINYGRNNDCTLEYHIPDSEEVIEVPVMNNPTDNCQIQAMTLDSLFDAGISTILIKKAFQKAYREMGLKPLVLTDTDIKYKERLQEFRPKVLFERGNRVTALIPIL